MLAGGRPSSCRSVFPSPQPGYLEAMSMRERYERELRLVFTVAGPVGLADVLKRLAA